MWSPRSAFGVSFSKTLKSSSVVILLKSMEKRMAAKVISDLKSISDFSRNWPPIFLHLQNLNPTILVYTWYRGCHMGPNKLMPCHTSLFIFSLCQHVTFYKILTSLSTVFIKGHVGFLQLLKWPCHTLFFTHVEPYIGEGIFMIRTSAPPISPQILAYKIKSYI